jgi:hypothetical protein
MNKIKFSEELALLINCLNSVFRSRNDISIINVNYEFSWERVSYLSEYHNFKPILHYGVMCGLLPDNFSKDLQEYSRSMVTSNLFSSTEFVRISKLLGKNKIKFFPYKGFVFLQNFYKGKQIRAIGDLDIVVAQENVAKALEILNKDGYVFRNQKSKIKYTNSALIELLPQIIGMNETTLEKTINGKRHFIDFHWGFHYSFLPYQIKIDMFFENLTKITINGVECDAPSDTTNFLLMVIHHGGRECWTNLKCMADLMGCMENFGDKIDWERILVELEEMKLKRPALAGFFLLQEYFDYELPEIIRKSFEINSITIKLTVPIIEYWENGYNILSFKGRLKYEKLFISLQDEGFSALKYFYGMYKMYSYPNPIESPRLITFPKNWYFFNATSKIVTYIYKRGFGKIIR